MATKKLLTDQFSNFLANAIIQAVSDQSTDKVYVTFGDHIGSSNGEVIQPDNSVNYLTSDLFQNMIAGKKIQSSDLCRMIDKIEWTTDTVYAMYDDKDSDLRTKNYYVTVDEGSYTHVFKCLSNNNGNPSTISPSFSDLAQEESLFDDDDGFYQTSDGYQWKYMYSVPSSVVAKFGTADYLPLVANTIVANSALAGAIDVIKVDFAGSRYDNYSEGILVSSGIGVTSIASETPDRNYVISPTASSTNGFFTNCIFHIIEGGGKGQYRNIVNYVNDGTNKVVVLDSPIAEANSTSEYQISPKVQIVGTSTAQCEARAIINSVGNTVQEILVLDRGKGYFDADATIHYSSVVPVALPAVVRPIIGPFGGHGYDAEYELNANAVGISVKFSNNEANTITTTNDFRTISIIKNPVYANVQLDFVKVSDGLVGSDGQFVTNECVKQLTMKKMYGTASINVQSSIISGTSTEFDQQFAAGDWVAFNSGNSYSIGTVDTITNATHMTISSNSFFTSSNTTMFSCQLNASGLITSTDLGSITITDSTGEFVTDKKIIGLSSGTIANVQSVVINNINRNGGYSTFNQMIHFEGTIGSGSFEADEMVFQSNSLVANARFHSLSNDMLYVTNMNGSFSANQSIFGSSSGTEFVITNVISGDVKVGSGQAIYVQNDVAVSRSNTQSELIKVIIGI